MKNILVTFHQCEHFIVFRPLLKICYLDLFLYSLIFLIFKYAISYVFLLIYVSPHTLLYNFISSIENSESWRYLYGISCIT